MTDIKKFGVARHLRGTPTLHVQHLRKGKVVHEGVAQSFWFRPLTAALSENPERAVAVSMLPGGSKAERLARQMDIYGRVEVDELIFFDATTHPLGAAKLRVRGR